MNKFSWTDKILFALLVVLLVFAIGWKPIVIALCILGIIACFVFLGLMTGVIKHL